MPEAVRTATEGYREEMDVLAGFIDDWLHSKQGGFCKSKWTSMPLIEHGVKKSGEQPMSLRTFGTRLGDREFEKKRITSGIHWYGLGLSEETLKLFEQPKTAN